ncbi:MAG: hypothetical protein WC837_10315 [Bellilinea sp.]
MFLVKIFHLIFKVMKSALLLTIMAAILFIAYRGSQPMSVTQAPEGMTYWQFMADRLDAAKSVQPSRCGWGMMLSLAAIGPIYSVVYTSVGINPEGSLAKVTAPDSDIPKIAAGAEWYEIPDIWWQTVERLSWTMLGKPSAHGCKFRPVQIVEQVK